MIDFETTLMEGLSISAKASTKKKPKKPHLKVSVKAKSSIPALNAIVKRAVGNAQSLIRNKPATVNAAFRKAIVASPALARPQIAKAALVKVMAKHLISPKPVVTTAISKPSITVATPKPIVTTPISKPIIPTIAKAALNQAAKPFPMATRQRVAANIVTKAALQLAAKPGPIKKQSPHVTTAKAHKAIAPIAHACKCQTAPVLQRVKAKMAHHGFPHTSVEALLAQLHDMNTLLDKAALQRLATFEHKKLESKHAFEHAVLSRLAKLSHCLPEGHPTRNRANLAIFRGC